MKIGDIVQVKTWDDMAAEFGLSDEGAIKGIAFAPHMKVVCGLEGTVRNSADAFVCLNIAGAPMGASHWVFAKESLIMVEEAPEAEPVEETIFLESNLDVLHREVLAGEDSKAHDLWFKLDDFCDFSDLMVWLNKPSEQEKEALSVDDLK